MATHSSTLAWKIPWTKKPGRLQSMRSQSWTRLSDFTFIFNHYPTAHLPFTTTFLGRILYSFHFLFSNKFSSHNILALVPTTPLNRLQLKLAIPSMVQIPRESSHSLSNSVEFNTILCQLFPHLIPHTYTYLPVLSISPLELCVRLFLVFYIFSLHGSSTLTLMDNYSIHQRWKTLLEASCGLS